MLGLEDYSTAMNFMEGSYDKTRKTITFQGSMVEPMSGKEKEYKSTVTFENENRCVHKSYDHAPTGAEFISMKIISTRRKQ